MWLKINAIHGILSSNRKMRIDIMNRNSIISLAMLCALWQTKRNDLLDLIKPFIIYSVGINTKVGEQIDIPKVCKYIEKEFGYRSFQIAVAQRVLSRETSTSIPKSKRKIKRENKNFYLIGSLEKEIEQFKSKRTECKRKSDEVVTALTLYLNGEQVCGRDNYKNAEVEMLLLIFFVKRGDTILNSVEDLVQLKARNDEIEYFIGKFILKVNNEKSVLMDYLEELVKGYFVTIALYLQAENPNVTKSAFKNVTFYLDTRILLGILGLKTEEENNSVSEMVKSLRRHGARIACFDYNIAEVNNILEAYKTSIQHISRRPSPMTLEFFDENNYGVDHVEYLQTTYVNKLKEVGIQRDSDSDFISVKDSNPHIFLNDKRIEEILLSINSHYNVSTLNDDLFAIESILKIRDKQTYQNIEDCRAVFATPNLALVSAIRRYCLENGYQVGFPIAISGEELCVIAWLKDFEVNNQLPKMRLLENVLAAITPSMDLMQSFYDQLDHLEQRDDLSSEEIALLRVDRFARNEMMEITHGDKDRLNDDVILSIRDRLTKQSKDEGFRDGQAKFVQQLNTEKNLACKRAEDDVTAKFEKHEKNGIRVIRIVYGVCAILFIIASIILVIPRRFDVFSIATIFMAIITTIESVIPLFSRDNLSIKILKRILRRQKLIDIDQRKKEYISEIVNNFNILL